MKLAIGLAAVICSLALGAGGRATAAEQVPWAVASDVAVEQRAIVVENQGARLAGTLFLPAGQQPRAAVIALHGAQVPLRTDPLYRHLVQILPRLGIALFLYDRRGSGESTSGGAAPGNFDLLAADAVAAFARLRHEPGIDPTRIGFWGLSQGGWLTLLAARKEQRAAFAIAVSAPMAGADVQMNFAVANILHVAGQPQTVIDRAIRARTTVDDYARGRRSRAEAAAAEADVRGEPWYDRIWLKGNIDDPEWKRQIEADPLQALAGSRVPTLILFGQADPWVPVAPSLAALQSRATEFRQVSVHVIDGADHAMMLDVPPVQQLDTSFAKQAAPNAPAYFALLGAWLDDHARPRR
ncbi:alpha/beta hydrolase family protein [Sphingomonas nostoxanthinifaciens]|uniref:alpha/beta hydrolase family protein n=1 Tax=Sphingomonas nostoxanthinifaciens TaxID=2872652 RepID=UPI001CC1CA88|nr:alpha/beta fold hydrolase [Sphingomonas nostoxanthinifaciens]UAK23132.1 lysophospholipase [Sphingomonas nostoxanthinifaciens]